MTEHKESQFDFRIEGKPAPGALEILHGFLNTWSQELGIEDLETPQVAEAWLREVGLWSGKQKLSDAEHLQIMNFRHRLRVVLQGREPISVLADCVGHIEYSIALQDAQSRLEPLAKTGCDRLLGQLMTIIYNSRVDGTWTRFKCCALSTCGWAYYDTTRSRTKRWCSMKTCGSRHKAREYYRRNSSQQ